VQKFKQSRDSHIRIAYGAAPARQKKEMARSLARKYYTCLKTIYNIIKKGRQNDNNI
jgi:hypothetical protein